MDDDHHDALVDHRMNGTDDRNDLKTDGNHVNRNYAPRDLMMDASLDVSLCLRMSDRLDDHSMDDDLMTDVNRVNRNCVRRDLKMDVNLDGKNLHVK